MSYTSAVQEGTHSKGATEESFINGPFTKVKEELWKLMGDREAPRTCNNEAKHHPKSEEDEERWKVGPVRPVAIGESLGDVVPV